VIVIVIVIVIVVVIVVVVVVVIVVVALVLVLIGVLMLRRWCRFARWRHWCAPTSKEPQERGADLADRWIVLRRSPTGAWA
jgi:hypothetical protein